MRRYASAQRKQAFSLEENVFHFQVKSSLPLHSKSSEEKCRQRSQTAATHGFSCLEKASQEPERGHRPAAGSTGRGAWRALNKVSSESS